MPVNLIKGVLEINLEEIFVRRVLEVIDEEACRVDGRFQATLDPHTQLSKRGEKLREVCFDVETANFMGVALIQKFFTVSTAALKPNSHAVV